MIAGICRYCTCEEHTLCAGGCAWTDATQSLCTVCLEAETLASMVVRIITDVKASARPPIALVTAAWSALTLEQKQLLVMCVRAITERITETIIEEIEEDTLSAARVCGRLRAYLLDRVGERALEGGKESLDAVIIGLLEPSLARRVSLS